MAGNKRPSQKDLNNLFDRLHLHKRAEINCAPEAREPFKKLLADKKHRRSEFNKLHPGAKLSYTDTPTGMIIELVESIYGVDPNAL